MPRATRNRTLIAQARVSEAELAKWRAKATAAGVPLSELLRRAMARTRTWTAAAAKVERERTRELARIGSNLNQIARWANTHKGNAEAVEVAKVVHEAESHLGPDLALLSGLAVPPCRFSIVLRHALATVVY